MNENFRFLFPKFEHVFLSRYDNTCDNMQKQVLIQKHLKSNKSTCFQENYYYDH